MKKLFVYAAAFGLALSAPALAQHDDHHGDKNDSTTSHAERGSLPAQGNHEGKDRAPSNDTHAKTNDGHATTNKGVAAAPPPKPTVATRQRPPAADNQANRYLPDSGDAHPSGQSRPMAAKPQNNSGWSGNANDHRPAGQSREGNGAKQHSDLDAMRRNMQAPQHFHHGNYHAPQGYQYRHWTYGEQLPRGYYARDYWIGDFLMFGLFAPPSDLIWVRVGDDALLINKYSGDIVQVRYGVFY